MHKKLLFLFVLTFWPLSSNESELENSSSVFYITIDAGITPVIADYVLKAIQHAEQEHAEALLINLDTPGGLLESTRIIVQAMLKSQVPIIVYVSPAGARAGSAGLFIALAAHVLAMAPSSNIGAAHPVDMMGGDVEGDMHHKVTNDAAAWARSLAQNRGRNADWAQKAVTESASISADEAQKLHVSDLIAHNTEELITALKHRKILQKEDIKLEEIPMSTRQEIMNFLADANLLYILLMLGLLGIFIEFKAPGLIFPALFGISCLAIVFGVQVLPINWFGALLILCAMAFLIAEIFITSFGVLALVGLSLLIGGSYLLFSVPGSGFFVDRLLIWLFSGALLLIILSIGWLIILAKRQGPSANVDALVGTIARVSERIEKDQEGVVLLYGTYWRAHALESIEVGERVKVLKVEGTSLFVEKISGV